jgi:cadmium resistance protein CadD (predicted permease)
LAAAGLPADLGVAAAAFIGTNIDNCLVTTAMVAGAPLERARRIAAGQVLGFVLLVAVSAAAAVALFEFSAAVVGLLGLVPLAIGVKGLVGLRRSAVAAEDRGSGSRSGRRSRSTAATDRAVGRSLTAAALVTIGAGGDNLAVYIPLFRVGGTTNLLAIVAVFAAGEVAVTAAVLGAGRHPRARAVMLRFGAVAVPVLLCGIGVLVLLQAGTFSLL